MRDCYSSILLEKVSSVQVEKTQFISRIKTFPLPSYWKTASGVFGDVSEQVPRDPKSSWHHTWLHLLVTPPWQHQLNQQHIFFISLTAIYNMCGQNGWWIPVYYRARLYFTVKQQMSSSIICSSWNYCRTHMSVFVRTVIHRPGMYSHALNVLYSCIHRAKTKDKLNKVNINIKRKPFLKKKILTSLVSLEAGCRSETIFHESRSRSTMEVFS